MLSANGFEKIVIVYAVIALILAVVITYSYVANTFRDKDGRQQSIRRWCFVLIILLAGYLCLVLRKHFCVDSFAIYWDMAPFHSATEGRYIKTAVAIFCMRTGLNQIVYQQLFFAIWIPVTSITIMMVSDSIIKYTDRKYEFAITAAVALFTVNTFYMELLLFPEVALENTFTNLLFGVTIYVALSENKRVIRWPIVALLMFMTSTGYQCYMPVIVIWVITGAAVKYKDNPKEKYTEAIYIVAAGIVSWGLNFLIMKLFNVLGAVDAADSVGELSASTIMENIKGVLAVQLEVWNNAHGTYRIPLLMTAFGLLFIVIAVMTFIDLEKKESRVYYLLALCGTYMLSFAVHFIESPQEITPRSIMPLWSLIAGALVFAVCLSQRAQKITIIAIIALIVINVIHMNDMSVNVLKTNAEDISEATAIAEKIHNYEIETGETITCAVMRSDGNLTYYHPDSNYKVYQLGGRIMATDFSRYHCIGYYLGHDLDNEFMSDEDLERLGKGKDWESFDIDEQVFVENGKAYIIVY